MKNKQTESKVKALKQQEFVNDFCRLIARMIIFEEKEGEKNENKE